MTTEAHDGKVGFVKRHLPDLPDGDYTITVNQSIEAKEQILEKQKISDQFSAATLHFSVLGPRFSLDPQLVNSVFPPAGSLGDHSNVLPHIVLNRSTLPWERTAIEQLRKDDPEEEKLSWLVLLLFEEGELAPQQSAQESANQNLRPFSVGELRLPVNRTREKIAWPGITFESGQHDSDQLSVIEVPWNCLKQIIPTGEDLSLLTHVRKTEESTGKSGADELAVVIGSRLPKTGSISYVHLVSVEGRYKNEDNQINFDHQGAEDGDLIRLVSLKNWRFSCLDKKYSFTDLLQKLLEHASALRLPDPDPAGAETSIIDEHAKGYLSMGCVPLPHAMRQGNKTVSWYRGPLVPGNNTTKEFPLPIRSADQLAYYDKTYGMFDISYAAAWELGRLLALQNKSFAVNLYRWKRRHARKLKDADTQLTHLPFDGPTADLELPEVVSRWFENLTLLEGVPFHYLVPDERMLPIESIRFFQIDPIWMQCLVDGAFSIGRVLQADHEDDQSHQKNQFGDLLPEKASGFLLRSEVVASWPGLQVDGFDESIDDKDFVPKKERLFEINPADCRSDLNKKRISGKLEQAFLLHGKVLSKENRTVENRQWLIGNGQQEFKLIKRENNQIDVCLAADTSFLFSIDASFETNLIAGTQVSAELLKAFAQQRQDLSPDSTISVVSWFITDNQHQKHYLVQKEASPTDSPLQVYRDYKLPLLRMARLSANILICLFEGIVQTVDLHLKPETLHCGVKNPGQGQDSFSKKLRELIGSEAGHIIDSIPIPFRNSTRRVIDVGQLKKDIQAKVNAQKFSAAEFGLEMVESPEKVRFSFKQ